MGALHPTENTFAVGIYNSLFIHTEKRAQMEKKIEYYLNIIIINLLNSNFFDKSIYLNNIYFIFIAN